MVDGQVVELSGRHFLISQLLAGGVEVAQPVRDRGIDLIAYLDRGEGEQEAFLACPLQMKASREARFGLDRKYAKVQNLLMVYVWFADDPSRTEVYAMTYAEAFGLLEAQGHTGTPSWEKGAYTLVAGEAWKERLREFRMTPERWVGKVREALGRVGSREDRLA